ncbi:MmgE/PrpD family protein [Ramlibacter sp.]|uniref:MmgE/PrpD family protein n=1 Tax=Ramlibacter sp. TaxID=1917967 RepID=UPI003D14B07F
MSDEGVTKVLANFCAAHKFEDLPPEAVNETKRIMLDTIGCGLGGHGVDKGTMAVRVSQLTGGTPEASILGVKGKVAATTAAFANGELMNALDWCPVMSPAHVPPFVLPPVFALAQARKLSGKDAIAAAAMGMEVSTRLGTATGGLRAGKDGVPRRVWGLSSNSVAGTAAAGHLMRFDAHRMLHALGTSGYYAPLATHTKFNYTIEQGYAKYGPAGWIAQGAVTTAQLAELGYHGDTTFLEGPYGFYVENGADSWDPSKLTKGLGQDWMFRFVGYKLYPTCGIFQSSANIFQSLVDELKLQPEEIEEIDVKVETIGTLPAYVSTEPNDHVEAASSAPFILAVIAHRIPRGPGMQAQSVIDDPAIRATMRKVRTSLNPRCEELRHRDIVVEGLPYPRHRPGYIRIKARGGQVFERTADFCPWISMDPDYRATDEALAVKFRENARIVLSEGKTERAIEMILNLEKMGDVSELFEVLAD